MSPSHLLVPLAPSAAAAALSSVPSFPLDYYTGVQQNIIQNQGGVITNDGACCPKDANGCKVETISAGSDTYQQGSMNRTLSIGGSTGVQMKWYGAGVNKLMALAPGTTVNSSHKYVCGLYCPLHGKFFSGVAIAPSGDKVKDLGNHVISQKGLPGGKTKTCHGYGWSDHLFKVIPMDEEQMWVDESGSTPVPFVQTELITPFGQMPPIAYSNGSFVGFQVMNFTADTFDVDMATVKSCKRQEMGKCPGDPPRPHMDDEATDRLDELYSRAASSHFGRRATVLETAKAAAAALAASTATTTKKTLLGAPPKFPKDYINSESVEMLINQGGATDPASGGICCSADKAGQCQVQQSKGKIVRYTDVTNQRMRIEDQVTNAVIVDLYKQGKSITVNVSKTTGEETCAFYCPTAPGENLTGFTLPDDAKDLGNTTYEGKPAELYMWKETIFKVIQMELTHLYVGKDLQSGHDVALFETTDLTPLGHPKIGTRNATFTSYKIGPPPASKFDVKGVDTCKRGNPQQCGGPHMQAHRLNSKQLLTWAMYEREW